MRIQEGLVQYLVREANRLGRKGTKVVGWIEPQSATQSPTGTWITTPIPLRSASDGDND